MKHYLRSATADIPASVVVFLVAIPLCLGIALGSSAPLFSGIIAGIVGGIVVGLLSGSNLSVSGPAAGLTVIVAAGITQIGSFEGFLVSVVIAGALQVLFGFLRAGVIGDYVPNSVIKGMLAAIGIILILKQLPHFFGYDGTFAGIESFWQPDEGNTFSALISMWQSVQPGALLIALVSLGILLLWELKFFKTRNLFKLIPGPLVAVIAGIVLNQTFRSSGSGVALEAEHLVGLPVAGSLPDFFSFFTFPDFTFLSNPDVWIAGVTLALIASLETLLSIEAVDKLDPYRRVTPNNRELKAQGIGNIVSGLLGGIPVTSVIVRSSANVTSGAITKVSAIFHGVLILLSVAIIPGLLNMIPLSALAAILIFVGYKLAKVSLFKEFWAKGYDQFIPFVVTIVAILLSDLLIGIAIGIGVGLFFLLRSNFHSAIIVIQEGNYFLVRFRKDVSFLNKPLVKRQLERIPPGSSVLIDAVRADFIDQDITDTINEYLAHAHLKNIKVEIKKSDYKKMHLNFKTPALVIESDTRENGEANPQDN
ncbi:MAG: SulP family inorganic anion transporter [Saprospirales bacterium]|nr:SulP family inorganic anion transporter [Saprospirales bacterium]